MTPILHVRHTAIVAWSLLVFLLAACAEAPTNLNRRLIQPTTASTSGAVACERSWTSPTSGDWGDATRWTPAVVPDNDHQVCFSAAGTYTVTVGSVAEARNIWVSSGAQLTLTSPSAQILTADSLTMHSTARLTTGGCLIFHVDDIVVDGALDLITRPSVCGSWSHLRHRFVSLVNNGFLGLDSALVDARDPSDGVRLETRGVVLVSSASSIDIGSSGVDLVSGSILGTGQLTLSGGSFSRADVRWGSTVLPGRTAPTAPAGVYVTGRRLVLADTTTRGAIDAAVDTIEGHVGSQVDVADAGFLTQLSPPGAAGPLIVNGVLGFRGNGSTRLSPGTGVLLNHGTMLVASGFRLFQARRLVNEGVMDVRARLTLMAGWVDAPIDVVNHGRVTVTPSGLLGLQIAHFEQSGTGVTTGWVEAAYPQDTRVTGTGFIEKLRLRSGAALAPGRNAGDIDTMTFDTLEVGTDGDIVMSVADPGVSASDRIHVNHALILGGRLNLEPNAAAPGGSCGQALSLFTMSRGASVTGKPDTLIGATVDSARAWRLVTGTTSHRLAGFDPRTRLSVSPAAVAVSEGGAPVTANVCLGADRPGGTVTVTPASRGGETTMLPSPMTFTTANWDLPQLVSLSAIDDTRSEGPHVDSVAFVLASPDTRYRGTAQQQLHVDVTDNDPDVDLSLTLVSAITSAAVNGIVEARYRVTNLGPGTSTGATFTLTPLAGATFVSSTAAASCTATTGSLTCTVGGIGVGSSLDFTLILRATTAGTHTNTARLNGREYDPVRTNNTVPWVMTIQ